MATSQETNNNRTDGDPVRLVCLYFYDYVSKTDNVINVKTWYLHIDI